MSEGGQRAGDVSSEHGLLWEVLQEASQGGKRFRPRLLTDTHDALGGDQHQAAAQVGAAVELLHTALVVHDDVIDDDHVRRGRPNVSGTYRGLAEVSGADGATADGYGQAAAILAGDLALAGAVRAVATCGADTATTHRLLDLLDTALHVSAAGELADVRHGLGLATASLQESLRVAEQKTAAYSFSLPLQAGAVLAAADEDVVAELGEAGRRLGTAFQLVDDLVGVFGDVAASGKSSTGDLRTAKQTPLVVYARGTHDGQQIDHYLGRDLDACELAAARDLLTACGARDWVRDRARQELAGARAVTDPLGISLSGLGPLTGWDAALPQDDPGAVA